MARRVAVEEKPVYISRLRIRGNNRTNAELIEAELEDVYDLHTFGEVYVALGQATQRLTNLGLFKSVDIKIDRAEGAEPGSGDADITITVEEKNLVSASAGAYVQDGESTAETSVELRNALGNGEIIRGASSYGGSKSQSMNASLTKPRFLGSATWLIAELHSDLHKYSHLSGFDEKLQSVALKLRGYEGSNELVYSATLRDLLPMQHPTRQYGFAVSQDIMAACSPSLKSSLLYNYSSSSVDSSASPTRGTQTTASVEVAGLGGDVQFARATVRAAAYHPLHLPLPFDFLQGPVLSLRAVVGAAVPWGRDAAVCPYIAPTPPSPADASASAAAAAAAGSGGSDTAQASSASASASASSSAFPSPTTLPSPASRLRPCDRFYLGGSGPLGMRGFRPRGAGPRALPVDGGNTQGDALGGDFLATACASLSFPLPHPLLQVGGIRGHVFAELGSLSNYGTPLASLLAGVRASAGAGIIIPTPVGRLEANYSQFIRSAGGSACAAPDVIKRAQLLVSMSFL